MALNGKILISFAALCFIGIVIQRSDALRCIPCERRTCAPPPRNCTNGLTKDVCQCCDVCAKVTRVSDFISSRKKPIRGRVKMYTGLGEDCGGLWNTYLSCGKGLKCEPNPQDPDLPGKCVQEKRK